MCDCHLPASLISPGYDFPSVPCVLTTMAFILILLTCQDYLYLRFFLIAIPILHDYLKCHFLREAFLHHTRRDPTQERHSILLCPYYHSLKVSYSFCPCLPCSLLAPLVSGSVLCTKAPKYILKERLSAQLSPN